MQVLIEKGITEMMTINCTQCGYTFSVPVDYPETTVICDECNAFIELPVHREPSDSWIGIVHDLEQEKIDRRYNAIFRELLEYERTAPAVRI